MEKVAERRRSAAATPDEVQTPLRQRLFALFLIRLAGEMEGKERTGDQERYGCEPPPIIAEPVADGGDERHEKIWRERRVFMAKAQEEKSRCRDEQKHR